MAITKDSPVVVEQLTANRFRIANYCVSALPEGPQLAIAYNAIIVTQEPKEGGGFVEVERIVKNVPPFTVAGVALEALCADADERTQQLKAKGLSAGLAYQAGQKAAIEAVILASIDAQ